MQIKSKFTDKEGRVAKVTYEDADSFEHLLIKKVTQAYGVCFVGDKMIVVYSSKSNNWILPGGSIEDGETFEECLKREVHEETNMKVLSYAPIGYQEVTDNKSSAVFQLRYACTVEPYGNFVSDPDGDVDGIKAVDQKEFKEYIKWGEIGDRILERAKELKNL